MKISLASKQRVRAAFFLLGLTAGICAFFVGQAGIAMVTTPSYQAHLPVAAEVGHAAFLARTSQKKELVPPPELPRVETPDEGNWVRIPSLSVNVPLAVSASFEEQDVLKTLETGVVRYPNGVEPGGRGVLVIAGHSTGEPWKGPYRFAFLNARKLATGDSLLVDHEGIRFTYRVTGNRIVNPTTTPELQTDSAVSRLSLISCWPLWSTSERLIVDAELVGKSHLVHSGT